MAYCSENTHIGINNLPMSLKWHSYRTYFNQTKIFSKLVWGLNQNKKRSLAQCDHVFFIVTMTMEVFWLCRWCSPDYYYHNNEGQLMVIWLCPFAACPNTEDKKVHCILVSSGRAFCPTEHFSDCWIFNRQSEQWTVPIVKRCKTQGFFNHSVQIHECSVMNGLKGGTNRKCVPLILILYGSLHCNRRDIKSTESQCDSGGGCDGWLSFCPTS